MGFNAGTYEITVAVLDEDDNEVVSNTANITLNYGEDGIMSSDVNSDMGYSNDWSINIWFATKDISGNLSIKFDGVEYYNEHIDSDSFDEEDDDDTEYTA